jgi:NAD(P)-dependent dehydrogenase (short-subunit alcohol dehydrogenase family)
MKANLNNVPNNKENKVVVVSGFFGYLGKEISLSLAKRGFSVVGLYNTSAKSEVETFLKTLPGGGHSIYQCDLQKSEEVTQVLNEVIKERGGFTHVVHTAWQKASRKSFLSLTEEEFIGYVDVTLSASFNFLTSSARYFKQVKQGTIIGILSSSVFVSEDNKGMGAYVPAKHALFGILEVLKEELHASNVSVYSVAPSFMEGGMNDDVPHAFVEMVKHKEGGILTKEEVAEQVASLCLDGRENIKNKNTYLFTRHSHS